MRRFSKTLREADSFESSSGLLGGYIGALLVAAVGKFFEGSPHWIWFGALMIVLVVTSFGQAIPAGIYNGLVLGLFYNFFFISPDSELSFHSASDWWLELAFIGTGVAAAIIGRLSPRPRTESPPPESETKEDQRPYLWNGDRPSRKSTQLRENSWTP